MLLCYFKALKLSTIFFFSLPSSSRSRHGKWMNELIKIYCYFPVCLQIVSMYVNFLLWIKKGLLTLNGLSFSLSLSLSVPFINMHEYFLSFFCSTQTSFCLLRLHVCSCSTGVDFCHLISFFLPSQNLLVFK